ncbi:MAG: hypothetical protein ACI9U2_003699 [Bradymonadia bacterium]
MKTLDVKTLTVKTLGLKTLCLMLLMTFGLAACGTTLETQQNRFKKNTDTIEAVAAKKPVMATAIKAKLASFSTEKDTIVKAGGEDAKTKLARLNSRMEAYALKLDPSLAPVKKVKKAAAASKGKAVKAKAPASKAPATTSKLAPKSAAPATTGKLGAAPATTGKLGAPATTGKLGAPATTGKLGAPAKAAPATTGKLGGAASQPAPR